MTTPLYADAWFRTSSAAPDQAIVSQYRAFFGLEPRRRVLISVHNGRPPFQINPGS